MNKQLKDFTEAELKDLQLNAFKQREQARQTITQTEQNIQVIEAEFTRREEEAKKEDKPKE